MGRYVNPGNNMFRKSVCSDIYVDKTIMLRELNSVIGTRDCFVCVSRPRRFGKSVTADMVAAYYSCGCDSRELFSGLKISCDGSFDRHLNRYNVIKINMADFQDADMSVSDSIARLEKSVCRELRMSFPSIVFSEDNDLPSMISDIYFQTAREFVFVVDEWDCLLRDSQDRRGRDRYLLFLRHLLKDQEYTALVYMTGILPVLKYNADQTALNNFTEKTMIAASHYEEYTGFTEDEVMTLCDRFAKPYDDIKLWYDGYTVGGITVYNPKSVVDAMHSKTLAGFWTGTASPEVIAEYIKSDVDGVRKAIDNLMTGGKTAVNPDTFNNDLTRLTTRDDVLTALVHLGYLTYDKGLVRIPNYEIKQQFAEILERLNG